MEGGGWLMGDGVSACAVGGVEINVGIVLARVDMPFCSLDVPGSIV